MIIKTTKKVCDICWENGNKEPIECTEICPNVLNADIIAWYACGHVYIIKSGIVKQTFNYAE